MWCFLFAEIGSDLFKDPYSLLLTHKYISTDFPQDLQTGFSSCFKYVSAHLFTNVLRMSLWWMSTRNSAPLTVALN